MAIVNAAHVTVEGTVEAHSNTGLKLDGTWVNLSKFRTLELPEKGARVRAEVDARGYLCSVEVLSEPTETPAVSRSETITRLAVLKAAANFLGLMSQCHDEVRSDHVLILADKWLDWVRAE